jgi:hypothetical protein
MGRSARVVSGLRSRDRVLIRQPEGGSRTRSLRRALLVAALREVVASGSIVRSRRSPSGSQQGCASHEVVMTRLGKKKDFPVSKVRRFLEARVEGCGRRGPRAWMTDPSVGAS